MRAGCRTRKTTKRQGWPDLFDLVPGSRAGEAHRPIVEQALAAQAEAVLGDGALRRKDKLEDRRRKLASAVPPALPWQRQAEVGGGMVPDQ